MSQQFSTKLLTNPDRLEVHDSDKKLVAIFTIGCHTVALSGPQRTFKEDSITITHTTWLRTLPKPFPGTLDPNWLTQAIAATDKQEPDILAIAMQYTQTATPIVNKDKLQIAGNASYGPLPSGVILKDPDDNKKRLEGSDFNDYLGIQWQYEEGQWEIPEKNQFRCLDCSGFMRIIWGYRNNFDSANYTATLPLSLTIKPNNGTIPRRAWQICIGAPGILIHPNTGQQITDFTKLQIGDLVFFDASEDDADAIDHIGMYIGQDQNQNYRFISSRKKSDGPNFGDTGGKSILNGTADYAKAFRAVRRL